MYMNDLIYSGKQWFLFVAAYAALTPLPCQPYAAQRPSCFRVHGKSGNHKMVRCPFENQAFYRLLKISNIVGPDVPMLGLAKFRLRHAYAQVTPGLRQKWNFSSRHSGDPRTHPPTHTRRLC